MSGRSLSTLSLPLSTLSALASAGYETVRDLSSSTPEQLSKDLNLPLPASQAVFSATRASAVLPLTQSAAAMMGATKRYSTSCAPLDKLLGGGLRCGSVLELMGPAGCGKELLAANAVKTFVEANQEVLFVDMQNMAPPATIRRILSDGPTAQADGLDLVHYQTLHTLTELVVFLRNLCDYLKAHSNIALLVLNSLEFPLQSVLNYKDRAAIMDIVKETLARACQDMNLIVIITSHLHSKQVPGTEEPTKWIMIPAYYDNQLPKGRTYRVLIVPQWKTSGVMRLLFSPTHVPNRPVPEEPYQKIGGMIQ
ncbi:P-loop containing nucleoside triphosphate hydrolase protein [Lentinus tigrinus ALCF2SS1-6]|uniref:P-loop containing nucleoside triphosphate hydrolase protein n=1 Tax=Lentinus tigrinus ALCF2SS1-6 TaxID=1328759 RepID=A0A5C2SE45_9APHY|nr:P-loop containing nucleoside triphosphate hydrolase protein [Lentinus tigrinus ALCF2SS1-6]